MAPRPAGVSGAAVGIAALGIYLAYAGIQNVDKPFSQGLRTLLRGQLPESGAGGKPFDPTSAVAAAVAAAGPATSGVSSTDASGGTASIEGGSPVPLSSTTLATNGIRVHRQIVGAVNRMIQAAKADGVGLYGSGYRSTLQQAALRIKNGCTCSDSSSCCRVPTAPVGRSMHERGLAIDFANAGSRDTRVYRWLAANAGRFGFQNLPSEPWHWSTNGH